MGWSHWEAEIPRLILLALLRGQVPGRKGLELKSLPERKCVQGASPNDGCLAQVSPGVKTKAVKGRSLKSFLIWKEVHEVERGSAKLQGAWEACSRSGEWCWN